MCDAQALQGQERSAVTVQESHSALAGAYPHKAMFRFEPDKVFVLNPNGWPSCSAEIVTEETFALCGVPAEVAQRVGGGCLWRCRSCVSGKVLLPLIAEFS